MDGGEELVFCALGGLGAAEFDDLRVDRPFVRFQVGDLRDDDPV